MPFVVIDPETIAELEQRAMEAMEAEAARELDEQRDEKEKAGQPMKPKQWADMNGVYTGIGETVDRLPPGMYEPAATERGMFFIPLDARDDEIIRFPGAPSEAVLHEIETFWEREEVFHKYGFPFKRGILLTGPPGSGKSTTLQLVSRDVIQRGGLVLTFNPANFAQALRAVRDIEPETPVVTLMEDLDALIERRESQVLNMLDGAEAIHKVVFLATTNYPERLDARIQNRPSRFDRRIEIGHPGEDERRIYLEALLKDDPAEIDVSRFVRDTSSFSLAHLKELFIATVVIGMTYERALAELRTMNTVRLRGTIGFDTAELERGYA